MNNKKTDLNYDAHEDDLPIDNPQNGSSMTEPGHGTPQSPSSDADTSDIDLSEDHSSHSMRSESGNKTGEDTQTGTNGSYKSQSMESTETRSSSVIAVESGSTETESSDDADSPAVDQEHQVHKIRTSLGKIRRSGMWDRLSELKDNAEDAVYSVRFKVKDAYDNTKRAVARAVKGYDSTAVWDCGPQLMVEIPKKLREFADATIGYPAEYDDPSNWLSIVPRGDDWPEKAAPLDSTRALDPDGDVDNGDVVPVGDDGMLVRRKNDAGEIVTTFVRNKDIGLGFAAWIEDVGFAADVIEEWGNASMDVLWLDKHEKLYGHDKAKELYEELHSKFKIVWAWLGENLPGLWI